MNTFYYTLKTHVYRKTFSLTVLITIAHILQAQTSKSWLWAKHPEGHLAAYTYPAISADGDGNTYVTGAFDGTLTFPTSLTPIVLTSAGEADIFIAKYDATGNVVWAKRAGGTHSEVAWSVKYDGSGSVYIAGSFVESTNFEGTIITNPVANSSNVLLAKYNAATGDFIWVRHGAGEDGYSRQAFGVTVDKNGDPYITGEICNTTTFAPLPTLNLSNRWWDIFVVKYNSEGVAQWQTVAGSIEAGYNGEAGNGIGVDQSGNVFVTGRMNGSLAYSTMFGSIPVASNGGGGFYEVSFFLAKYNQTTSSWEWAINGGGNANDYGKSVSLDNQGNAYVSGYFEGVGTFGSTTLTSTGSQDYFIGKYSNNGNQVWLHSVEGGGYNTAIASKADFNGNFYFAGTFGGNITIGDQNLTSNGYDNMYVSAWNSNGDFQWVKHVPGNYYSQVSALEVEGNGNIDITSVFAGTETFDCTTFGSGSYADLAIAKLGYGGGSAAPSIHTSSNNICSGTTATLSIADGNLNNATDWKWYTANCGGTLIGSGPSIIVSPTQNTAYYVRSEGGCAGPGDCGSMLITVNNTAPVITSVAAPLAPVAVNTSVSFNVTTNSSTIASSKIKWGDVSGDQTVTNPATNFTASHTYTSPGVYTVVTTITDACGNTSAAYQYQYVVIYDPSAGFVTGGGWINSPPGAYRPDVALTGKAIFGFESRYQNGATVPAGNTEFKFQVANMNFKSTNYQWLVVSGSRAQFKGSGTINGSGNYGFILTAVDGDLGTTPSADLFRIKIWDINSNAIVYDNQYGTSDDGALTTQIGGGSIVIHTNKFASSAITSRDNINGIANENGLQITALPNPTTNHFRVTLRGGTSQTATIRVIDVLGRVVETRNKVSTDNMLTIGDNYKPGTYLIEVVQGYAHQTQTVIKQ